MSRVAVVHHRLQARGGGEFLAVATINALKKAGHEVWLISNDRSIDEVNRSIQVTYGRSIEVDRHIKPLYGLLSRVKKFSLYQRIPVLITARNLLKKGLVDLVINVHGDMVPISMPGKYILYCHYPTIVAIHESPRYRRFPLNIYVKPYLYLLKKWKPRNEVVLCNSNFSKKVIKQIWGIDAKVLYPPVPIDDFSRASSRTDREPLVCSLGRFTREKRYEVVIKALPKVISEVPEARLVLIGSAQAVDSRRYLAELRHLAEKLGVSKFVEFRVDAPFSEVVDLLGRSMVYVHAMVNEHFGISIVEAMAAGCVPVVHASGGPYEDIVEYGKWGLYFRNVDELSEQIIRLLTDRDLWLKYHNLAVERSKCFSEEKFMAAIVEISEQLLYGT